jgi:hypothetical protein
MNRRTGTALTNECPKEAPMAVKQCNLATIRSRNVKLFTTMLLDELRPISTEMIVWQMENGKHDGIETQQANVKALLELARRLDHLELPEYKRILVGEVVKCMESDCAAYRKVAASAKGHPREAKPAHLTRLSHFYDRMRIEGMLLCHYFVPARMVAFAICSGLDRDLNWRRARRAIARNCPGGSRR